VATVAPLEMVEALELFAVVLDAEDLVEFDDELVVELLDPQAARVRPARPKPMAANRIFMLIPPLRFDHRRLGANRWQRQQGDEGCIPVRWHQGDWNPHIRLRIWVGGNYASASPDEGNERYSAR